MPESSAPSRSLQARLREVQPAGPHVEVKARLAAAVEDARAEILALSHRIHAHP